MITNHFGLEVPILAAFDQVIEAGDIFFCGFSLTLIPAVESRSLDDHVLADVKKLSSFCRTVSSFFLSSSLAFADVRMSSASSPKQ